MNSISLRKYTSLNDILVKKTGITKEKFMKYLKNLKIQSGGMPRGEHSTGVHYYQTAPNRRHRSGAGAAALGGGEEGGDNPMNTCCAVILGIVCLLLWSLVGGGGEAVGRQLGGGTISELPPVLVKECQEILPLLKEVFGKQTVNSNLSYLLNEALVNEGIPDTSIECLADVIAGQLGTAAFGVDYSDIVLGKKSPTEIQHEFILNTSSKNKQNIKSKNISKNVSKTRKNRK